MRHWQDAILSPRRVRLVCCACATTILLGCDGGSPSVPLANYLSRLSLALSTAPPTINPAPPLPPPNLTVQRPQAMTRLDTLDSLTLRGCAVQNNIHRRQTSLARQAKPSQKLLLVLEYLRQAPGCIEHLRHERGDALADLLQRAWREQQAQLPTLIFNATLGSREFRAFWLAEPLPGHYPQTAHQATVAALHAINDYSHRWLNDDFSAPEREFELLLGEVAGGAGGVLLQELSRQHDYLLEADLILQRNHASIVPALSRTISSAFELEIAPQANLLARRYRELLAPVAQLETQLSAVLPGPYRHWSEQRNNFSSRGELAPDRHLQQLALMPQQQACTNPRHAHAPQNWLH